MFKRIIVGIDGTKRGRDALALGRLFARETGASLVLCCVYPLHPLRARLGEHDTAARADAERHITEAREALAGVSEVDHRPVGASSPARGLQRLAEEERADLIVVGSSHHGHAGRVLPGSVGERLLHGAPCAVAIAPSGFWGDPDTRLRVIGVAYQHTPDGAAALATATELALHESAALRVITVVDSAGFSGFGVRGAYGYAEIIPDLREECRDSLHTALNGLPPETRPQGTLLEGDVTAQLAAQSETLDLLVIGSRGYGLVGRVLLGAVSGRIVREAACPVLVVPSATSVAEDPTPASVRLEAEPAPS